MINLEDSRIDIRKELGIDIDLFVLNTVCVRLKKNCNGKVKKETLLKAIEDYKQEIDRI